MQKNRAIVVLFLLGIIFLSSGLYLTRSHHPTQAIMSDKTVNLPSQVVLASSSAVQNKSLVTKQVAGDATAQNLATVAQVLDGDTIVTQNGEKIRYLGINAPEVGQPLYDEAKQFNSSLVLGKQVSLTYDIEKKDRYGRTLAYLFINNSFINKELVAKGLAVSETIAPNVAHQDEILAAQKQARSDCLGIWEGLCSKAAENNCIHITINANPPGDDTKNKNTEWISFSNSCSSQISMNNWLLKDSSASNSYTFHNFSLSSNASVKLHSGCGQNTSTDLYWACPEQQYAIWNNSGDHAYLYDAKGELVTDFQY